MRSVIVRGNLTRNDCNRGRYWFKAIDMEADGWITRHDMEFFYKEQLHRMDCLAQEVVQFEDMMCQMTDMVKPEREGFFSVVDLKR